MCTLRVLLLIALSGAAMTPAWPADEAKNSDPQTRIREVAAHVRKVLEDMRDKLDQVEGLGSNSEGGVSASVFGGGMTGPTANIGDFQRSAREVSDGAALVSSAAAKCGKDAKLLARRFNTESRRLQSAVDQLSDHGEMGLMRTRNAIEQAHDTLGDLGGLSCGSETGDEDKKDDEKKEGG